MKRRTPPTATRKLLVLPTGEQQWHPPIEDLARRPAAPAEVWVYLTDPRRDEPAAGGEPGGWRFRDWLNDALQKWGVNDLTMHIVSFNGALLHGNILDELDPLSQTPCRWQVIVLTDGSDLTSMAMIDKVLRAGLHELQVYPAAVGQESVNHRVLSVVKDLTELRQARGQSLPKIVCRVCAGSASAEEMTQWVRQVNIDRLDIVDKDTEEQRIWGLWSRNSGAPA